MGSLYGFEIRSEPELERLNSAAGERGEIALVESDTPFPDPGGEPASTLETEDGELVYASFETEDGCLLRMPPTGEFLIDPAAATIAAHRADDDDRVFEHRFASTAVCTLLAARGDVCLHAAALEVDGRALIVCGASMRGKSTLARALGGAGHPVLAEDGIVVRPGEIPTTYPGARGIRARPVDGEGEVELVADPGPREPGPCPTGALVVLEERGAALRVERLDPVSALARLTPTLIHDGTHAGIGDAFGRLAQLLHTVPAFEVTLPDDLSALPEASREMLDYVAAAG